MKNRREKVREHTKYVYPVQKYTKYATGYWENKMCSGAHLLMYLSIKCILSFVKCSKNSKNAIILKMYY